MTARRRVGGYGFRPRANLKRSAHSHAELRKTAQSKTGNAYVVNMDNGNVNNNNKDNNNYVRAVSEFQNSAVVSPASGLEGWFEAYYACRRNKVRTYNAARFEAYYERNLIRLWQDVEANTYRPSPSIAFIVDRPVKREIFAADFRDRIVHHWIALRIEPLLEAQFVDETFNCRKGKGNLAGIGHLAKEIRQVSCDYTRDCWVMKLDLQGFFMSIDRKMIADKLCGFVENRYSGGEKEILLHLLRISLMTAPEKNCRIKGDRKNWIGLDSNKSLFTNKPGFGLPVGNLLSQMSANFLLDETAHYIRDELELKFAMYVDDIVLVDRSKEKLLTAASSIRESLKRTAGATLHPRKFSLQHYTKGVKFIGGVVMPGRMYVSNRTVCNAVRRIHGFNERAKADWAKYHAEAFAASINSYLGIMSHFASYNIRKKLVSRIDSTWWQFIEVDEDYTKLTVKPRYKRKNRMKYRTKYESKTKQPCPATRIN